jgi:ribulose-phosphate 3-epimerase
MDGHFVPNLTIGPPVVEAIHRAASVPLDVHLMISDPLEYAREFAKAGAHVLTFHVEVVRDLEHAREIASAFRGQGVVKVGLALNPDTPIERAADLLDEVDLVLVMSVFPGFGGQKFMPEVLSKTRWLRDRGWHGHVEMDGGLNVTTLPQCAEAGADVLVAGSAIFGAKNMPETIAGFRASAEEAQARAGSRS